MDQFQINMKIFIDTFKEILMLQSICTSRIELIIQL